MRLKIGDHAPHFTVKTLNGDSISLEQKLGKPIWLAFFRYAACPLCSFRVHELLSQWPTRFARHDFELLTVWQSTPDKLEEIQKRYDPHFTLVTDPDMNLYRTYGVESGLSGVLSKDVFDGMRNARSIGVRLVRQWDGPATRRPADFLISADGVIRNAFYGENVAQQIPFDEVETFLGDAAMYAA